MFPSNINTAQQNKQECSSGTEFVINKIKIKSDQVLQSYVSFHTITSNVIQLNPVTSLPAEMYSHHNAVSCSDNVYIHRFVF